MKKLLKRLIFTIVIFYLLINFYPGLSGSAQWENLVIAALIYLVLEICIKPLLKILLIPINILTLGLAGSLINAILLFLLVLLVPSLHINPFTTPSIQLGSYILPPTHLGYWASLIVTSFLISFINSILWVILS